LICGESIESILETSVNAEVDQADFSENVVWVLFTTPTTGKDLYGGALVLDNSADYATLFLWDAQTDEDLFLGVIQRTTGNVGYSEPAMEGSWSGIAVWFEEFMDTIDYNKESPLDVTLSQGSSLVLTGTDPDGMPLSGSVSMEDTDYGYVEGIITALVDDFEVDFDLEGFVSPDGEFFGAAIEEQEGSGFEWTIIGLRKQEVLE
jgi:hypothetical protein